VSEIPLTEQIRQAETIETVHGECRRIARSLGFPFFLFGVRLPLPLNKPCQLILSGYPPAWRSRYDEQHYMLIDPVLKDAMNRVLPFDWESIPRSAPEIVKFFTEAASFGLRNGVTAPVHGINGEFSLLSMATPDRLPCEPEAHAELLRQVQWYATHIHEAVRRIALNVPEKLRGEPATKLTAREKECLRQAASGASTARIADTLKISERTVIYYIQRCQEKLGVRSRQHAIARALSLGQIEMDCYPSRLGLSRLVESRPH
jgi:DNA-binding CsgD family transcriptional regulator